MSSKGSQDAVVKVVDNSDAVSKAGSQAPERRREATWQDAAYHSVTAMVGAGVLGLPSTFISLGWAGGIIAIIISFWIAWYTYKLLVDMHEIPDPETKGAITSYIRFDRYQDLTCYVFGKRAGQWSLLPFQTLTLFGMALTYTVVGAEDLFAVVKDYSPAGMPAIPLWGCFLIWTGLQILLSQLPDFGSLGFVSALGSLMSVGYCTIATGLAAAYRPEVRPAYSVPLDTSASGMTHRVIDVFAAISTILFAYGGHNIALEIQATLPEVPTVKRMMRGVNAAFVVTGVLYLAVSISGFAALGVGVGPNIILALSNGPMWVRNMARIFVVIHVLAAYQVYIHPVFDWIESFFGSKRGCGAFHYGSVASTLLLRTIVVCFISLIGMMIPFFGDLMAFIGAVAITPTTFLLPPLLWLLMAKPRRWGLEWCVNVLLVIVTGICGILGAVSGAYLIASHASEYKIFGAVM
ncbi:MAG: transmembrane amino acid transporter protein-domain-containing protein [Monoraphidium minutum]|nr:MAG: transmembrane amino acid transporter protein-domain-containing protein [Monoraphidium minutum]